MRAYAFVLVGIGGLVGCSKAGPTEPPAPVSQPQTPAFKAPAPGGKVVVEMTAATLADDCGGTPPSSPPPAAKTATKKREPADTNSFKSDDMNRRDSKMKRKCEQSSMQLSLASPAGAKSAELRIRRVELLDAGGALIGQLTPSSPTMWSDAGSYVPWDQQIEPGRVNAVSYVLSQPDWSAVKDRANKTYVLKAVITVGGADETVQKAVEVQAETSLPANVKT